jgi:hypothetical protein
MRGITRFVDGSQDATPVKIRAFSSTCHTRRLRAVRRNDKVVYLLPRDKSSGMMGRALLPLMLARDEA